MLFTSDLVTIKTVNVLLFIVWLHSVPLVSAWLQPIFLALDVAYTT